MKISLNWLNDFVDISEFASEGKEKPQQLADLLTKAGLEVESIEQPAKAFKGVVVGLILEKGKHPNADRLSLCQVTTGEGVVHQIVCGAQNHKANDRVVVALPGAVLPGNFAIAQTTIRGVASGGMLCSEKELGLAAEGQGIMILPADTAIGKPFAEYMGFDDVYFELKVTPNRADCLSQYGLAREVACLLSRPLKKIVPIVAPPAVANAGPITLEVLEPEICRRYCGRLIEGVKVGPSPDWLKKRLEGVGLNSINNIVDITNYVMMELGQPLHAFDVRNIKGQKIIVGKASAGEKFETLDGTTLTLSDEDLVIRDGERAVALAGVVGGKNSGIQDDTQSVFLESAYFQAMNVRKTSRRYGINTESSYRFSRGVDPQAVLLAMNRATELILQLAGGACAHDHHDFYPKPIVAPAISVSVDLISERLGYEAKAEQFESFMKSLGCEVSGAEGLYQVTPPSFRMDLNHDMDLVEEYARLAGYEHIPEAPPSFASAPKGHDRAFVAGQKLATIMRAQGFDQALNLAMVSNKNQNALLGNRQALASLGLSNSSPAVTLVNPLSEDGDALRLALIPGLFQNAAYNFHQGNGIGRLFEIGSTFARGEKDPYLESTHLGMISWGHSQQLWSKVESWPLVYQLKSAMESVLVSRGVRDWKWEQFSDPSQIPSFLHRGQAVALQVSSQLVGFIGTLHPALTADSKIRAEVAVAEFNLDSLLKKSSEKTVYRPFSRYPIVERDLAFLMPKSLAVGDVSREICEAAGPELQSLEIFDIYQGENMSANQKSAAFHLVFQSQDGTLQEEKVLQIMERITAAVKQKYSLTLR